MKQFLLFVALLAATAGFGKIPKPKKDTYVNDFAGVLKPEDVRELNVKLHRIERLSSVQMAIVLVDKLPDEYDIEEYALLIGRKWHVGKNKNGLVYVAAISQRKQRLEVASLLKDKISDEKAAQILDVIKPFFREQNYSGGLNAMVAEVSATVTDPPAAAPQQVAAPVQVKTKPKEDSADGIYVLVGLVGVFIIIILIARATQRRRRMKFEQAVYNNPKFQDFPSSGYSEPMNSGYYNTGGSSYRSSSGIGPALGGFAAGYAARTIQDHLSDDYHHHHHSRFSDTDNTSYSSGSGSSGSSSSYSQDSDVDDDDQNSSDWGNWADSSDSSSSSDDSSSSSPDSGFDGDSGATSDW